MSLGNGATPLAIIPASLACCRLIPASYCISLVKRFLMKMFAQRRTDLRWEYLRLRYMDRIYWKSSRRMVHLKVVGAGPWTSEIKDCIIHYCIVKILIFMKPIIILVVRSSTFSLFWFISKFSSV